MKKSLLIFLSTLCFFIYSGSIFWADDICWEQTWYSMYTCRVENICEEYKSEKPSYSAQDYERAEDATPEYHNQVSDAPALASAKEIYRENMGNIYKCSIIWAQINSLEFLKNQLSMEASGELDNTLWGQIDIRINKLELSSNKIGCSLTEKERSLIKLNVLKETTYQACKHVNYLEYLKSHYASIDNNLPEDENAIKTKYLPGEFADQIDATQARIAEEIAHTYKVFPIAFHAYSEYENNFPIHFLLEIIRSDFMILRDRMYESLMPIAQLWLKVINAMSY